MTEFAIDEAAFAGLRLVGRQTLAAFVWAAMAIGSFALLCVLFGGGLIGLIAAVGQQGGKPDPAAVLGMLGGIGGFFLLLIISSVILNAVISCAIFRAELHPAESRFFYLRFGPSEGWLMLVHVVRRVVLTILQVALSIPVTIVSLAFGAAGGLSAGQGQAATGGAAAYLLVSGVLRLIVYGVTVWISLRLSLAGPMTFSDRTFRLFESWTLTRGLGWRLFLVALLLFLVGVAVMTVLGVVGVGGGVAMWAQFPHPATFQAFISEPPSDMMRFLAPYLEWTVLLLFVGDIVMLPVSVAPWAYIYRRLRPEADVAKVFE